MTRPVLEHDWYSRPLPDNVVLGERSWLYSSYAFLHYQSERPCGVRIGHDCGIYINTLFDLGPDGEMVVGDFCTLNGPIISTNGRLEIGSYALIAEGAGIADSGTRVPWGAPITPSPS